MAKTGLEFSADGGSQYLKIIAKLEKTTALLDKQFIKAAKSGTKFNKMLADMSRKANSALSPMQKISKSLDEIGTRFERAAKKVPKLGDAIEKSFKGRLADNIKGIGSTIGLSLIQGMEKQLGSGAPRLLALGKNIKRGLDRALPIGQFLKFGIERGSKLAIGLTKEFAKRSVRGMRSAMEGIVRTVRTGVQNIKRELDKVVQSVDKMGASLRNIGTGLMVGGLGLALGTIAAVAFPVAQAQQFEKAMLNAQAILGASNEEMAILNEQVLEMGGSSLAGVHATSQAYFDIVSGVADATTHMDILSSAMATSEAGQADLTGTTKGLIAVLNSYTGTGLSAAQVSDVFTQTVTKGVGSMDSFVAAISPIAGLAKTVGVSFEELGTGMAFLTSKGATTGAAATRLRGVMVSLLRPNEDMNAALHAAGFASGQVAIEQLGLVGALEAVDDALGNDTSALAAALGRVEALQGAVALLGDDYSEFSDVYSEGLEGATVRAQEIQMQGLFATVGLLKAAFGEMATRIGLTLVPILNTFGKGLLVIVGGINDWMKNNEQLLGTLVRFATIAGVVLGSIIAITGAVVFLSGVFASLFAASIGAAIGLVSTLIGLFISPFGLDDALLIMTVALGEFGGAIVVVGLALKGLQRFMRGIQGGLSALTGTSSPTGQTDEMERQNDLMEDRENILKRIGELEEESIQNVQHQVEAGDTLWDLAQKYGVTVEEIRDANDIEGSFLSVGQELIIPVSIDSEKAEGEIAELTEDLSKIDGALETLGDGGVVPEFINTTNDNLSSLVSNLDLVVQGFVAMASGDITGGLDTVKTAIGGITTDLGNLATQFMEGFGGGFNADSAAMFDETGGLSMGTSNPFMDSITNMVSDVQGGDFSTLQTMLSDNMSAIITGAVSLFGIVLGFPIGSAIGLGRMVLWAIESDFLNIGTLLEESGVSETFRTAFETLKTNLEAVLDTIGFDFDLAALITDGISTIKTALDSVLDTSDVDFDLSAPITEGVESGLEGFMIPLSVLDPVLESFTILKDALTGALQGLFTGLFSGGNNADDPIVQFVQGMESVDASSPIEKLVNDIQPLLDLFMGFGATALDNLPILTQGIVDFFTGLVSGIDMEIVGQVLELVGTIVGLIVTLGTVVGSGVLGGLSAAAGDIGSFFAEVINFVGALIVGDFGSAFEALVNGLLSLLSAIGNFTVGAADGVILALNNLFSIELPSVDEGLTAWGGAFELAWIALEIIIDNIKRGISTFALGIQNEITGFINGIREQILAATAGTVDIAPNLGNLDEFNQALLAQIQSQDTIAQALGEQVGEGAINLDVPIEINGQITTLGVGLENVGTEGFGAANTQTIINALGFAYESGDLETVQALLPIALDIGIEVNEIIGADSLQQNLFASVQEGDIEASGELIEISTTLGLNVEEMLINLEGMGAETANIIDAVWWNLQSTFAEGDAAAAERLIPLAATLGIDVESIIFAFEGDAGLESIRESIALQMATAGSEGDEETFNILIPTAITLGLEEEDVLEQANEAGLSVGDEFKIAMDESLGIESPSQYAIDTGINISMSLAQGMAMGMPFVTMQINNLQFQLLSIIPTLNRISMSMGRVEIAMEKGFQDIADSAKGLFGYLRSIKLMMDELGLTAGQANAAVLGGAGQTGENILAAAGFGQTQGGLEHGGTASAGSVHEINEGGIPEVGIFGGRTYLFAPQDGVVIPPTPLPSGALGLRQGLSEGGGTTINYNGDFNVVVPDGTDPETAQELIFDAIEDFQEEQNNADKFKNSL